MINIFKIIILTSFAWLFFGCSEKKSEPIAISLNNWVGYAPVHYVKEKGWMKGEIEFYAVVSLSESLKAFYSGSTNGFCGTQYEYRHANALDEKTVPIILLDRSNGGDGIMSNLSIENLIQTNKDITVYLETQSVNSYLFDSFVKEYGLVGKTFKLKNIDQYAASKLTPNGEPTVIVTYEPYITELSKKGFFEIASTKNVNLLVIDAIFVQKKIAETKTESLRGLKQNIDKALAALKENPKEFYETVKPYLQGQTYEEFLAATHKIEWLSSEPSPALRQSLQNNNIAQEWIIK